MTRNKANPFMSSKGKGSYICAEPTTLFLLLYILHKLKPVLQNSYEATPLAEMNYMTLDRARGSHYPVTLTPVRV